MIRTLIVEPAGGLWGSERALLDLIEAVPHLEIAVCCPPQTRLEAELKKRGVRVLPHFIAGLHQKPRLRRLEAAVGVLRACLSFRPDVIHLNQSGAYRVTLPAATLLGLPVIGHVRIFEDAAYLARQNPDPRRLKGLIAISRAIEEEILSFPSLSVPVHQIYDAYDAAPPEEGTGIERVRGRIACVGRVVPIKNQELLLEALTLMQACSSEVECLIVGDGAADYVGRLQKRATREGSVRVEWLGFADEITQLLRTCQVLVCPSHREPLGRVVLEAWDAGAVPVVFSGSGGAAEIVAAANGGILYDEQRPESLAAALHDAMSLDQSRVEELVDNGRSWMARNCNLRKAGDAVSKVLSEAGVPRTHSRTRVG
jgi:glycosyltransferase involved in cell wall biosynthesis